MVHTLDRILDTICPEYRVIDLPRGFGSSNDAIPCWLAIYDGRNITAAIRCECGEVIDVEVDGDHANLDHEGYERKFRLIGWEERFPKAKRKGEQ